MTLQARSLSPDSLRAVVRDVLRQSQFQWHQARDPWAWLRALVSAFFNWLGHLESNHPTAYKVLLILLVAALAAMLIHAAVGLFQAVASPEHHAARAAGAPVRDSNWYRARADQLALERRYLAAMQADFVSLALTLDANGKLRFHSSRTPAEYLHDSATHADIRTPLRDVVRDLYRHVFARASCSATEFAAWRGLVDSVLDASTH